MKNNSSVVNQYSYRNFYLNSDVSRARLGLSMLLIPIMVYVVNDYNLFGFSSAFYFLWAIRAALFGYTLFLIFYLNGIKKFEKYDRSIAVWEFIVVIGIVIINLTRPAVFIPDQVIISVIYIFIICLVIPIRLLFQAVSALIIAFSVLGSVILNYSIVSVTALLSLLLACGIGVLISWQLDTYRKIGFLGIEKREAAEKALRISEERFRSLVESTSDWIWQVDADVKYTYVSPKVKDILGYTPDEVLGKSAFDLMPKDEADKNVSVFREIVGKRSAFYGFENWNVGKDGRLVLLEMNGVPVFDDRKQLIGYRGVSRNITKRKEIEEELKLSKSKLEEYATDLERLVEERTKQLGESERMAAIGQTAGMVGHDLRNPLQTIINELYLAKMDLEQMGDCEDKEGMGESLLKIGEEVSYMDKIVSDLQSFVRPIKANKLEVDLNEFLTAVLLQTEIPKNVQTNLQVDSGVTVFADPQLLKRVLINLVTNAVQAMPQGGILTLRAQKQTNGEVQIVVEDTGVGVPDEIKPKLFTPLFTTKSKGQGFGLGVCKRVIEAQGGTISFESQLGKGTKFKIKLPEK